MGQVPEPFRERLAARIKVMARLDVAEKRLPQDGRIKLPLPDGRHLDLRVSTLPTLFGEKVVVRVLDARQNQLHLAGLGYEAADLARLQEAIHRPHGMVLVTGPTGSGKTQSLYACLQQLNTSEVNIATVEDPCEIQMPGINQVNVQDKPGLGFAVALRAFLRQDPDILMVGEIRDLETAQIAVQAAQTGHLVLSTLHTNSYAWHVVSHRRCPPVCCMKRAGPMPSTKAPVRSMPRRAAVPATRVFGGARASFRSCLSARPCRP